PASVYGLGQYGLGLFVGLPFGLGLMAALLYGYHQPRRLGECLGVALLATSFLGLALLLVAVEGLICILMAAPIGMALALLGATLGYVIQRRGGHTAGTTAILPAILLMLPAIMGAQSASRERPPLFAVVTAIDVDAPPEAVWR